MVRSPAGSLSTEIVVADGVARRFARRWALRGVSLRVRAGEVVAVRGSNGSGKSTLLRILASALRPTRGSCRVLGHDVVRDARHVRPLVGLLGQAPGLYDELTVAENLRFAARMLGVAHDARSIAAAVDAVGLAAAIDERARDLSSGMQRRVALARLTLASPKVLLLDEPYNSFDADGIGLVDAMVRRTAAAGGAVVLVTHDVARSAAVTDRLLTMDAGLIRNDAVDPTAGDGVIPIAIARAAHGSAR